MAPNQATYNFRPKYSLNWINKTVLIYTFLVSAIHDALTQILPCERFQMEYKVTTLLQIGKKNPVSLGPHIQGVPYV
jgi:hypothetical protein